MARTKLTPKKDRGERRVLQMKEDREKIAKKGRRPPSPVHHPSPARKPSPMREVEKMWEEAERWVEECDGWRMWVGHHHHCQPNSWPRWLQRLGHLLWGRSQSGGSSALLWEAKPPRRSSSRPGKLKIPGSTGLAQLLFGRSGGSKTALSSLSGNSPSHG